MRVTTYIKIENISLAKHKRLPITPKVLKFAIAMYRGDVFPAIKVQRLPNGSYKLKDGRNRLSAIKLLGRKKVLAHFAIPEDPRPDKGLTYNGKLGGFQQKSGKMRLSPVPKE